MHEFSSQRLGFFFVDPVDVGRLAGLSIDCLLDIPVGRQHESDVRYP